MSFINKPPRKDKPVAPIYDGNMMLWQYCIGILHLASKEPGTVDLNFLNTLSQTRFEHLTEVGFKVTYRVEFVNNGEQDHLKRIPV